MGKQVEQLDESPTHQLAEFAAQLRLDGVPADAVKHLRLCVLDTIGVGLFGSVLTWNKVLARLIQGQGGKEESTLWGRGTKVPSSNAALVNGMMIHGFELDDLHKEAIVHCGSVVVPAALAVSEMTGVSTGPDLVAAIVAGYEVMIRVGTCMGTPHLLRGYHPTGTCGVFGAAAAAGNILGLNGNEMVNCLGIAGSCSAGLMAAQYGAMVKRMHAGRASQAGVMAALLAKNGFTGIADVLEAEYGGFCNTLSDGSDQKKLTDGLFTKFKITEVGFKPYSCGGSTHTSIDAILRLTRKYSFSANDVERIEVKTTTATKNHAGWAYTPSGVVAAQMNIPYVIAITLLEGAPFVDQFTEEKVSNPTVVALTKKIEVLADVGMDGLGPDHRHAVVVRVTLKDGRKFEETVHSAKGSSTNPMSEPEIVNKFRKLAQRVVGVSTADEIISKVNSLEKLTGVQGLTSLLNAQG